jgi:uncharacterized protein YjbI with pentapeptide repeats
MNIRLQIAPKLKLRSPIAVAMFGVVATVFVALLVVFTLFRAGGTQAISDNVAIIGAVAALGGVFTTQMVNTALENQRAQNDSLQKYLEYMGELLTKEQLRNSKNPLSDARVLARSRTLALLKQLDGNRKRIVLQFLREAQLINKNDFIINGRTISAQIVELSGADLSNANLSNMKFISTDLVHAISLASANLENADLRKADLRRADLRGANLRGAYLRDADLRGADLETAFVTQRQVEKAFGDENTKLPVHLTVPAWWKMH